MEFGLRKPRAFSAICMRAYFMIQNIRKKRIALSFSE